MTTDQQPYLYVLCPSSTESQVNRLLIFFHVCVKQEALFIWRVYFYLSYRTKQARDWIMY